MPRRVGAVAVVLWATLGWAGAHRFYLGWNRSGALYLCTLGICGLGWLSDAFLLRTLIRQSQRRDREKASAAEEEGRGVSLAAASVAAEEEPTVAAHFAHAEEDESEEEESDESAAVATNAVAAAALPPPPPPAPSLPPSQRSALVSAASPPPPPPGASPSMGGGRGAPKRSAPPKMARKKKAVAAPKPPQLSSAMPIQQQQQQAQVHRRESEMHDEELPAAFAEAPTAEEREEKPKPMPMAAEDVPKEAAKKKKKKKASFAQFDLDNVFRSLALWLPRCTLPRLFALLLFLLLVGCSLWLVLPAFFLLLLFATTHIEETSEQMVERQETLAAESTAKRGARWVRIIAASTPITAVFAGFPAVVVWLLPRYGEHAYWAGIVGHTSIVLMFVVLGVLRNLARIRVRERICLAPTTKPPPPIGFANLRNWIVFFALLYETVQLAVYPFMKPDEEASSTSTPSSETNTIAGFVIPAIFLTLKQHLWLLGATMGPAVAFALVLLFCGEITNDLVKYRKSLLIGSGGGTKEGHERFFRSFTGSVAYGHGHLQDVSPFVSTLFDLLANTLFMTACSQMISQFSCAWEARCYIAHPGATYVSLMAFSFFAPLAILCGPMLMEGSQRKKDLRWAEGFLMATALVKMLLLLATAFSSSYLVRVYSAIIAAVVLFLLTFTTSQKTDFMTRPCAQPVGNVWRCMSYAVLFLASLYCLVSTHFSVLSATSLSIIVAVCGMLLLAVTPCIAAEAHAWKLVKSERESTK